MHHLARFIHSKPKIFGIMGYHTGLSLQSTILGLSVSVLYSVCLSLDCAGIYCVLRLGSQPNANSQIDEADDVAIQVGFSILSAWQLC